MKTLFESQFRRDLIKLLCLAVAVGGMGALFIVTPALSTPTLLSIVITMLLSPVVAMIERRGAPRPVAIALIFLAIGLAGAVIGVRAVQSSLSEWESLKVKAPQSFQLAIQKLREYESLAKERYSFLQSANPTDSLLVWGQNEGRALVEQVPALMGSLLTWLLIVPFLTFVMLNEGNTIRRRFFQLVPNRFFESFFLMSQEIASALSDYLRAKLVEAFLVGLMTAVGLALVGAPYFVVLGIIAGVTNILPYIGPVVGAIPGLLIAAFDRGNSGLIWPVLGVYLVANVIDTVLIFPVIVAKLVNLHPLILIAVVALGQQYYGLLGMLLSIPLAAALKVVLQEVYLAVYEQRSLKRGAAEYSEYQDNLNS